MRQYFIGVTAALVFYILWSKITFALRQRKFEKSHGTKPPNYMVNGLPFGIDYVVCLLNHVKRQTVLEFMRGNYEEYGHTFAMNTLGKTTITTREPKNLQAMLSTQFKDFSAGDGKRGPFGPLMGQAIINLDGPAWEHHRALLRPQFSRNQITQLQNLEEHFITLTKCIPDSTSSSSVDLQELFFELTMDTSTDFLFGESTDTLKQRLSILEDKESRGEEFLAGASFAKAFNDAQEHSFKRFCMKDLYALHNPKEFRDAVRECHLFVDRYVNSAIERAKSGKAGTGKYIFMDAITKDTLNPSLLRDAALSLLLAGRDTTGSLIGFIFYLLVRHPEIQDKLRKVIYEEFGPTYEPSRITFESLKNCKYLKYVIDEVSRLYPTIPINGRVAARDTTLPLGGGIDGKSPLFVPKGTPVEFCIYAMHRRVDIWGEDAHCFRPERWETRTKTETSSWEYLPFNGGPRVCIGQQFALTETAYTVVRMFQEFKRFESGDMDPFVKTLSLLSTCVGGKGVLVRCYRE
ncbi:Protein kinase alk2 [Orbilia oligospora]|uniref:Protein kinase alk2 n=1 Tax=Orbilia oligospora TaxID=2813651 RepID=A0A7C8K653_ORBOL|nr:Protein kinase alk2 [Orbilia oligospora]